MRVAAGVIVGGLVLSALTGVSHLTQTAAAAAPTPPEWQSVQTAGGQSLDGAHSVALASGGIPIVVGTYSGTAYFPTGPSADDSIALGSLGGRNVFVATLDAQGEYFTWAQRASGAWGDVYDVVVMGTQTPSPTDDTIVVMGTIVGSGTMYFPTGAGDDSIALSSTGSYGDMFVAAARVGERFTWAQLVGPSNGNPDYIVPGQMTLDAAGAPVLTGAIEGYATGTIDFPGASGVISIPSSGTFVAALSGDDSTFEWVQRISGASGTSINGPAIALRSTDSPGPASDHLVITGGIQSGTAYFPTGRSAPDDSIAVTSDGARSGYVAAMNADDSYFAWVTRIGGSGSASPRSIAVAPDGRTYVAGIVNGTISFPLDDDDSVTLDKGILNQGFVASLPGDDSYFSWATALSGARSVSALDIAVTGDGTPIVVGEFLSSLLLPSTEGNIAIPAWAGEEATYVAAMDPGRPTFAWAQSAGGVADDDRDGVSGRALALLPGAEALIVGRLKGDAAFPSAQGRITVRSRGSQDVFAAVIGLTPVIPAVPIPPLPASAPRKVVASAGDASAAVAWSLPETLGSFPVTNYVATSSPGGRTCLVSAPALTCNVTGLTNGTAHTFTVKALTGAGWSASSEPSNAVVPRASVKPSLVITGAREGKRIVVAGSSTGLERGALLTPHVARSLEAFRAGSPFLMGADGSIAWSRRASAAVVWRVYLAADGVRSNTVTIR